ncbi:hypothetical protein M0R45_001663 [Rubus argutus]|uniref:Uncharacterized protein n=1 Tax=Rubus argutus TaxID=59490 RepID=A0AAW1VK19_RUBAR
MAVPTASPYSNQSCCRSHHHLTISPQTPKPALSPYKSQKPRFPEMKPVLLSPSTSPRARSISQAVAASAAGIPKVPSQLSASLFLSAAKRKS